MGNVIVGTEAIRDGVVTRHGLARWYRPVLPNIHAPRGHTLTLSDRAEAAWLWSRRRGVITGLAAAAAHGSQWIDAEAGVELVYNCPRPPAGVIARNERLADDEWQMLAGLPVATPARTAFDLGRFQPTHDALARLDALMRARPYSTEDVLLLAKRYRGRHGVARLKEVLPFVDGRAESPRESWWRKLVIDCGFPAPATQIAVTDGSGAFVRILDFGWEAYRVAVEYDGEHHQADRGQYLKDRRVIALLQRLDWNVVTVVKEDDPVAVLHQVSDAMWSRGWRGPVKIPAYAYQRRHWARIASEQEKCE